MTLTPGTRMHDSAEIQAAIDAGVGQDPSAATFTGTTTVDELDSTTISNSGTVTTATMHATTSSTGATTATTLTATGATVLSNASITIANLGTVDPTVAGRLWNNKGVLTVSAG